MPDSMPDCNEQPIYIDDECLVVRASHPEHVGTTVLVETFVPPGTPEQDYGTAEAIKSTRWKVQISGSGLKDSKLKWVTPSHWLMKLTPKQPADMTHEELMNHVDTVCEEVKELLNESP